MTFLNQDGVISTDCSVLIYDAIENNGNFIKLIKRNHYFGDMIGVKLDGSVVLIKSSMKN
ncbi:MAG: hypothetical protein KC414_11630 [Romboutsia sp.]|nr:hypothetical protein [Romboutsia sp.]